MLVQKTEEFVLQCEKELHDWLEPLIGKFFCCFRKEPFSAKKVLPLGIALTRTKEKMREIRRKFGAFSVDGASLQYFNEVMNIFAFVIMPGTKSPKRSYEHEFSIRILFSFNFELN